MDLPGDEKYNNFDLNDQIHFVFINSDELSDKNQLSWLINDLETIAIDFIILTYYPSVYSVRDSSRITIAQSIRAIIDPFSLDTMLKSFLLAMITIIIAL
ncbi:MAG: hypothetical protein ACFFFH_01100 [Candidatus Thorarchaeota archaeon]